MLLQAIDKAIEFLSEADELITVSTSTNASSYNIDEDDLTCLDLEQTTQFKRDGFCILDDERLSSQTALLIVRGYVRRNYDTSDSHVTHDVLTLMISFYHSRFNERQLVRFSLKSHCERQSLLIPRRCVQLSSVLTKKMESVPISAAVIELSEIDEKSGDDKLEWTSMLRVFRYLAHHDGKEPDPLPCPVRSIHMAQICSDKWDATWMDGFTKKEVFEIILQANSLGVKSLLHLGCAKIATLIKQLDQKEINRIIEEEEKYRREQAAAADSDDNQDQDNEEDNEEVMEIDQVALNDDSDYEDEDAEAAAMESLEQAGDLEEQLSNMNYSPMDIEQTSSLIRQFSI